MVADKEGTIVVADMHNHRLRKIRGRQVTTLAGGSEAGAADGAGAGARFTKPVRLALDERGRLLVAELSRADTLRVVEASLAPPAWMGPVDPEAAAERERKAKVAKVASQSTNAIAAVRAQLDLRKGAADKAANKANDDAGAAGEGVIKDGRTSLRLPSRRS